MSLDGVFLSLSRLLEDDQSVRESIKEKVKEIDTVGKKASVDAQGSFSAVTGVFTTFFKKKKKLLLPQCLNDSIPF